MLTVTQLCGLGGGGTFRPEYTLSLGSCSNFELLTWVKTASGWNGVDPCKITVNIVSNAIISASSTGYYALYVRNFPASNICDLTINNYGWVVGCGGAGGSGCYHASSRFASGTAGTQGGPAIYVGSAFKFDNRGVIGAGGGGGAGTSPGGGGNGGVGGHCLGAAGGGGSLNAGGGSGLGGTMDTQGFKTTYPCPRGGMAVA